MAAIVEIARYGARIGYQGKREGQRIARNLTSADELPEILEKDLTEQGSHDRLATYQSQASLPPHFYASPLALVDKPYGKKRSIHHLSHPTGDSIYDGVPTTFGEINSSSVYDVIAIIEQLGPETIMIKRDFVDAFRQIPVSPEDTPLLGFSFRNKFYAERFLPFGL